VSDGIRIQLPDLAGDNELTVVADAPYMNTGEGLHRFVDPVDNEVYLYTQFEVPDSRRMFAVFEQPDLKATFTFTVMAPSHWDLISNSPTPVPQETTPADVLRHAQAVLVRHSPDRRTVPGSPQ
jgi:aminopeptidase N